MKLLSNEPVLTAVGVLVAATITLLVAFGVHVTADQREAIEAWVAAAIVLGVAVRAKVTPNAKVQETVATAYQAGLHTPVPTTLQPAPEGVVLPGPQPPAPSGTV